MSNAKQILAIASKEIGYKVNRGNPSKYGLWYDQPGFESAAWCAMFVSWVFHQANMPIHPIQHEKGFAYCPFGLRWFKDNNMVHRVPRSGDIVFFDWGKDGVSDHVGIVESVHPTHIKTIEGNTSTFNQSNGGGVMRRTRYFPSCCGFARPNYDLSEISWSGFYIAKTKPLTTGQEVKFIQEKLNKLGYGLKPDGVYGNATMKAVMDFQAKNDLEVDGVVGAQTWAALA